MIKNLELSTFRGLSASYAFDDVNRIAGPNGVGKTSIQEAVCFIFGGTDSIGTRMPLHLVSLGADKCKAVATTSKATLTRSLTAKKFSSTVLEKDGVRQTLNQQELERMLCPTELFLSVFVPGTFMRFPAKTKHAVFNSILPKVERQAVLQEMSGVRLTDPVYSEVDLSRRPDLIANDFAIMRRKKQNFLDQYTGRIAELRSLPTLACPEVPEEKERLRQLHAIWDKGVQYKNDLALYTERMRSVDAAITENTRRQETLTRLKDEFSKDHLYEVSEPQDFSQQIAELGASMIAVPPEPLQLTVVESDHCPTCGQIVGSKHKEDVREQNHRLVEAYRARLAEIKDHNFKLEVQIGLLREKDVKATAAHKWRVEQNQQLEIRRARLEARIASLTPVAIPAGMEEPPKPDFEMISYQLIEDAREVVKAYEKEKAQYDYVETLRLTAEEKIKELLIESDLLQKRIDELQTLETCMHSLPAKEFEMREGLLLIPGYKFVVGEDISLVDSRGVPYELLSAAEKTRADVMVSLKVNALMQRKVGMIFIDNAEHLDEASKQVIIGECRKQKMQVFFASVGEGTQISVESKSWGKIDG